VKTRGIATRFLVQHRFVVRHYHATCAQYDEIAFKRREPRYMVCSLSKTSPRMRRRKA
jgi:hypothetical protein